MKVLALAAAALFAMNTIANAASYQFSYEFGSGDVISGLLDGTLQGDNDTIHVNDFGNVTLNGVSLPSIEPIEIASVSDFNTNSLQPRVSISGGIMDVFVCAQGFSTANNCSFFNDGGFFFSTGGNAVGAFAGDGTGFLADDDAFNAQNWTIAAVPLPATLPLLALAIAGFAYAGRRRPA